MNEDAKSGEKINLFKICDDAYNNKHAASQAAKKKNLAQEEFDADGLLRVQQTLEGRSEIKQRDAKSLLVTVSQIVGSYVGGNDYPLVKKANDLLQRELRTSQDDNTDAVRILLTIFKAIKLITNHNLSRQFGIAGYKIIGLGGSTRLDAIVLTQMQKWYEDPTAFEAGVAKAKEEAEREKHKAVAQARKETEEKVQQKIAEATQSAQNELAQVRQELATAKASISQWETSSVGGMSTASGRGPARQIRDDANKGPVERKYKLATVLWDIIKKLETTRTGNSAKDQKNTQDAKLIEALYGSLRTMLLDKMQNDGVVVFPSLSTPGCQEFQMQATLLLTTLERLAKDECIARWSSENKVERKDTDYRDSFTNALCNLFQPEDTKRDKKPGPFPNSEKYAQYWRYFNKPPAESGLLGSVKPKSSRSSVVSSRSSASSADSVESEAKDGDVLNLASASRRSSAVGASTSRRGSLEDSSLSTSAIAVQELGLLALKRDPSGSAAEPPKPDVPSQTDEVSAVVLHTDGSPETPTT